MGFKDDFAEGMDTLSPQSIKETITTTKKTNKMSNIAKAIIAVMKAVKGIEKNSTVGKGTNSAYQGVSDKDVKEVYSKAMAENGLCILPIGIEDDVQVSRWEEKSNYGMKQKQSVFCSVKTKYLLLHISGESQEISGYGHGIDSQDKAAGKATTYALKYALLYTFMTPTGKIDDSDTTHSEEIETPQTTKEEPHKKEPIIPSPVDDDKIDLVIKWAKEKGFDIKIIEKAYSLTALQKATILKAIK